MVRRYVQSVATPPRWSSPISSSFSPVEFRIIGIPLSNFGSAGRNNSRHAVPLGPDDNQHRSLNTTRRYPAIFITALLEDLHDVGIVKDTTRFCKSNTMLAPVLC